jgi:site-specific recombinase XerD
MEVPQICLRLQDFQTDLREQGRSVSTINNRLSAVCSLLKYAFRLGISKTDGRNLIDKDKAQSFRDTRGIERDDVHDILSCPFKKYRKRKLFKDLTDKQIKQLPVVLRDTAILRLFSENAFRLSEVLNLDVRDFSMREKCVLIQGKGRSFKEPATLSVKTTDAIAAYILAAGLAGTDGPLFQNFDRNPENRGKRLTSTGMFNLINNYGKMLGFENLTPHKLRHTAITLFLNDGGDLRHAQKLARHRDMNTTLIYDDNRQDFAGDAVRRLSELYSQKPSRTRRR